MPRHSHAVRLERSPWSGVETVGVSTKSERNVAALVTVPAAAAVLAFYWAFIQSTTFTFAGHRFYTLFDDAMISMRYARNFAGGYGLVWNPGEAPVEGYTNLLWTCWMALLHLARVSDATVSLLVSISGAATIVGTAFVARAISRRTFPDDEVIPTFAFWGTLVYYPLVFWSLRGMEVGLIACLLALCVLFTMRLQERFSKWDLVGLGTVASLGVLTRMEFLMTATLIAAFTTHACTGRRFTTALVLTVFLGITIAALTAFRFDYYGELLPNTYYLKLAGIGLDTRLVRGSVSLLYAVVTHFAGLVALIGIYLANRKGLITSKELLLLLTFVSSAAYSVWVGGDAWEDFGFANRYIAPAVPLALILSAKGAQMLFDRRPSMLLVGLGALMIVAIVNLVLPDAGRGTSAGLRALANAAMAGGLVIPFLVREDRWPKPLLRAIPLTLLVISLNLPPVAAWAMHGAPHSDGDAAWAAYGLMLRDTTAPDARVAVTWAGAVSYFSQRPTLDELGKTDASIAHGPHVAPVFRPGHSKWNLAHTIGELQPDVIASLFLVNDGDLANIRAWGYEPLIGSCFYRRDSARLDVNQLRSALERLQADPRFAVFTCGPFLTSLGNP